MSLKISSDFNEQKEYTENVSHEIQTPLAIISSKADELLQSENLKKEEMEQLEIIMNTTTRLAKINQALILLTKIDNRFYTDISVISIDKIITVLIDNFKIETYEKSLDIKDFDISFARGLSLEDGCATITNFTAYLIAKGIEYSNHNNTKPVKYLVCGGGRKNTFLIQSIKDYLSNIKNISLEIIDKYNCDGDYIESQAFGYLAIRSFLKLPISFPKTTGCNNPTVGGKSIKNF